MFSGWIGIRNSYLEQIDEKIESTVSDKVTDLHKDLAAEFINIQANMLDVPAIQAPELSTNKMYIEKEYDSIEDKKFKSNLMLADEIIDRASYAGVFTEWDGDELNTATQELEYTNQVFIMNKLINAYNSQKITGKLTITRCNSVFKLKKDF